LEFGLIKFLKYVALIFLIQIAIAFPFLNESSVNYLSKSFSTSRIYLYEWTVNMKFLSEEMFHSNVLNKTLMISMMLSLLFFGLKWSLKRGILKSIFENNKLEEFEILEILFTSNFVGFIFLKSFHYQFYVWYFHSLPFLLEFVEMNNFMKVLLFGLLEYSWNVFPSTPTSSLILQAVHFILFVNLIFKIRK
jgi:alpha-1,3-mannosyltransferase